MTAGWTSFAPRAWRSRRASRPASDISARYLRRSFDAILIAAGSRVPRDLKVPGRELGGIHFALDFLSQQNRLNAGEIIPPEERISAADRNVAVIGGGDTGSDCIGTCRRQGAREIHQLEILPEPPAGADAGQPLADVADHPAHFDLARGRLHAALGRDGEGVPRRRGPRAQAPLRQGPVDAGFGRTRPVQGDPGSQFELQADLVLLSMGFIHAEHGALVRALELALDARGNIQVNRDFMTSAPGVFAAGDSVLGASLVVRAIHLGRAAAEAVDAYLARRRAAS